MIKDEKGNLWEEVTRPKDTIRKYKRVYYGRKGR